MDPVPDPRPGPSPAMLRKRRQRAQVAASDETAEGKLAENNDMHTGIVPPCLQALSQVEEMLIARGCPITYVICSVA